MVVLQYFSDHAPQYTKYTPQNLDIFLSADRKLPEGTLLVIHEVEMGQFKRGAAADKQLMILNITKENRWGTTMKFTRDEMSTPDRFSNNY